MSATVKCPTCEKTVKWSTENPYRPFCCERCKLIDLGAWADESHRISGGASKDFLTSSEDGSEDLPE